MGVRGWNNASTIFAAVASFLTYIAFERGGVDWHEETYYETIFFSHVMEN